MNHLPRKRISLAAAPPPPEAKYIPIWQPKPGCPLRAMFVSSRLVGVYLHWDEDPTYKGKGRNVPHVDPPSECRWCRLPQSKRWHGFAGAWVPEFSRYCLLDITASALHECPKLHPAALIDLRGRGVILRRIGKHSNSPVTAELAELPMPADRVPKDIDVPAVLRRLWGLPPEFPFGEDDTVMTDD